MQELASWPRPAYVAAERPFVYLAIFGASMGGPDVSRSRHRCAGVPRGIDISAFDAQRHGAWADSVRSGYLWDKLQREDPALAQAVAGATSWIVLRGEPADDSALDYLRDIVGIVQAFFDNGAACVYDPQQFKWWSAADWRREVFDAGEAVPHRHVVTLMSRMEDGTQWFHTRGMRLFGRPDLSMHGVTADREGAVVKMFDRFIDLHASGGIVPEGQPVRMAGLPDGLACRHAGDIDDPDFNNVHIEIGRPAA